MDRIGRNWSVKDEIREYWTIRAGTYDESPGHGIAAMAEAEAWRGLVRAHLGAGEGRQALDLACGTGVMTLLLHDLGFATTGLDFTEAMMARARHKAQGTAIRFIERDAEETFEPEGSYDAILARHLVWTLPNPEKAFREWFRLLKPGGRLLIIDGDFVRKSWVERLMPLLDRLLGERPDGHSLLTPEQWQAHWQIVAQLPFREGLRAPHVEALFAKAGFTDVRGEPGLAAIRRARRHGPRNALLALARHRFAISAVKPDM